MAKFLETDIDLISLSNHADFVKVNSNLRFLRLGRLGKSMNQSSSFRLLISSAVACGILSCVGGSFSLLAAQGQFNAPNQVYPPASQAQPINRLGARFESPKAKRSAGQPLGGSVSQPYGSYASAQTSPAMTASRPDNNPGLPLSSAGQIKYEQSKGKQGTAAVSNAHNSQSPNSQSLSSSVRSRLNKVSFKPPTKSAPQPVTKMQQQENSSAFRSRSQELQLGGQQGLQRPAPTTGLAADEESYTISPCPVQFINDAELPALESGPIKALFVKEGDLVLANKIIGQIDDQKFKTTLDQTKLKLSIAQQKAKDETSLLAAEYEIKLGKVKYNRPRKLNRTGSAPKSELEEAEFSLMIAMLKKNAAQNERDNANGEAQIERARVKEVNEMIGRHQLKSKFDGFVIEIAKQPGEWVNAGEPVMRIARMDRLWVQGVVDSRELNPHEVDGRPVEITLKLARGKSRKLTGKIVHVGLEREGANQFLVKAEVKNEPVGSHWLLQPNSTVTMKIDLKGQASISAAGVRKSTPVRNR